MDYFELGYEYSIDVPEVDNQHRELAKRLNEAIKSCTGRKADEEKFYKANTRRSIELLKEHFDTEEKILKKTKYENFKNHKLAHKKMLNEIKKMNSDIEKKKVELNLFYVSAFIKEKFLKHIKTFDLPAKSFFVEGKGEHQKRSTDLKTQDSV